MLRFEFFPSVLSIAVTAVCRACTGNHGETAVWIAMDQARDSHVPFFFKGVIRTSRQIIQLPGVGKTLKTYGIFFIRYINQGQVIWSDGKTIGFYNILVFICFLDKLINIFPLTIIRIYDYMHQSLLERLFL